MGDTTGGGGHTVSGFVFTFDGFRMGIRVPRGRAYNPQNNEGWEGVGVIPHIAVPADQALDTAHADALRKLIAKETDDVYKATLTWALQGLESRMAPLTLTAAAMQDYVGQYGPRRVFLEDGVLQYQRDQRPQMRLEPMDKDLFRVGDLDYFRASFVRDDDGRIVKFVGLYDDGTTDEHDREEG